MVLGLMAYFDQITSIEYEEVVDIDIAEDTATGLKKRKRSQKSAPYIPDNVVPMYEMIDQGGRLRDTLC